MAGYLTSLSFDSDLSPRIASPKEGPPSALQLPSFHASPAVLRERANEIAEDLNSLLRRYETVINERMRLKLLPAVSLNDNQSCVTTANAELMLCDSMFQIDITLISGKELLETRCPAWPHYTRTQSHFAFASGMLFVTSRC